MNRPPSAIRGYLVALVSVAVVVLIRRYLLVGVFSNQVPVGLFLVAVIASAWVGGMRAGLLAVGLGVVGAIYTFAGVSDAEPATLVTRVQIGAFAGGGVVTSYVTNLFRTTNRRLADRQRELELQQGRLADEIEHRRVAETALRDREERIRMAVESADIGTWDLNVATRQRQWSDRSKAMFGLPPEVDPSTIDFLALLHPDDRQHVAAAIEAALDPRGNGSYQVEYRRLRDDGTIRWVVAKGQAFFQGEGDYRRALRFIGTVIDITERKELEHALHEADRRKNDFLAMLAHELRNPLVPMRNALDIWPALEREPGEMAALRAMMRRQVRQMIRLIDDLLDVSRMTRGKIELRFEPLDLGQVITRAVEAIQPVIHGRDHRLAIETGEPIAMVGDAARLTQVFSNILHNAAKYTDPQGSIKLVVGREQDRAVVTVSDNGRGIDPGMLTEIFEPFRQCDSSSNRSDSGLGIGLTLARQVVEMHAGTIEAEMPARARAAGSWCGCRRWRNTSWCQPSPRSARRRSQRGAAS